MCGITGWLRFDGRAIRPDRVVEMAKSIVHRGPDGQGLLLINDAGQWALQRDFDRSSSQLNQPSIGLAHLRLSIIDLSERGAQPMHEGEGRYWIVFNGELYNYIELREELIEKGHQFISDSDTEVVLRAYIQWGDEAVHHFNGMFAFLIWDTIKRRAFAARDHLGIKPFYYWHQDHCFLFGSEQKAILPGLSTKPRPNAASMADFLAFSYVPSTSTMFAGIQKLPPGSWLSVDRDGVNTGVYWDPSFQPVGDRSEAEWTGELRELLHDSIRMQIRSDVPIGAHLSGGIDSSTVTCLAAQQVPHITTFTAKFAEGGFFDETPYARLVAEHVGAQYQEITPRPADLISLLPRILYHLDEPVEAASVFGKYHVAEIVSQSVKVVLGGQGGDELFGGYDWYVKSAATALSFGASGIMNQPRLGFLLSAWRDENAKRLLKSLWKSRGDRQLARVFYRNWARMDGERIATLLRPEFYTPEMTSQQRFSAAFDALAVERASDGMFKFDMRYYLESLLTSEDRLSMAFSVESRVPLLDYRIAELASGLGFEQKATPGCSKRILRQAIRGIVPDKILDRTDKRGFPTPIGRWLRDPKLDLMNRFVFNDNAFAARYFDLAAVRRQYESRTWLSTDWAEWNWRLLNLCAWGQVFELE